VLEAAAVRAAYAESLGSNAPADANTSASGRPLMARTCSASAFRDFAACRTSASRSVMTSGAHLAGAHSDSSCLTPRYSTSGGTFDHGVPVLGQPVVKLEVVEGPPQVKKDPDAIVESRRTLL
jgi:hypothetical protein